jgi:curved DNA-binding protein CbpA
LALLVKKNFYVFGKNEEKRAEYLKAVGRNTGRNRVYVDENGINSDLKREYGRARSGIRIEDARRGRKFHRVNAAAAVTYGNEGTKKIASECFNGSMNGARFEKWFEYKLLDSIPAGSTVILDRASFHRKKQLEEICAKVKVNLLFLPA